MVNKTPPPTPPEITTIKKHSILKQSLNKLTKQYIPLPHLLNNYDKVQSLKKKKNVLKGKVIWANFSATLNKLCTVLSKLGKVLFTGFNAMLQEQ